MISGVRAEPSPKREKYCIKFLLNFPTISMKFFGKIHNFLQNLPFPKISSGFSEILLKLTIEFMKILSNFEIFRKYFQNFVRLLQFLR